LDFEKDAQRVRGRAKVSEPEQASLPSLQAKPGPQGQTPQQTGQGWKAALLRQAGDESPTRMRLLNGAPSWPGAAGAADKFRGRWRKALQTWLPIMKPQPKLNCAKAIYRTFRMFAIRLGGKSDCYLLLAVTQRAGHVAAARG